MSTRLNYCAELQIELARLKIFAHSLASQTSIDEESALTAESLLDGLYLKLAPVALRKSWIYPRQIATLRAELVKLPWTSIYQHANYSENDVRLLKEGFARRLAPLTVLASELNDLNTTALLLELVRFIRVSAGVGARTDEHLYEDISRIFVEKEIRFDTRQRLNAWARRTQELPNASEFELLSELMLACPRLAPAQDILEDLLERMTHLIYVPLVFDKGKLGVSIPVKIVADFNQSMPDPVFRIAGREQVETPPWLQVTPSFVEAVKRGRERAVRLLSRRGRNVEHQGFKVTVNLPDLRIRQARSQGQNNHEQLLVYDQGSIEYPVALTVFPQHPLLKRGVPLNPEVMTTGPIEEDSLEPKIEASKTVGRIQCLFATSEKRLLPPEKNVRVFRTNVDHVILENYFTSGQGHTRFWESINRKHSKILSVKDAAWDQPLRIAESPRRLTPPLIPTIKRHQAALEEMFSSASAVQLQGLSGIGKTFLIAQWMLAAQQDYDLVIYISIPSYPPEEQIMAKWAVSAFEDLARQLNTWWRRPELLQKLTTRQTLTGSELIRAIRESLWDCQVLWVIDHGEALLNSDFTISESSFRHLIDFNNSGEWENSKLLFVANRRLELPLPLPVYELSDGFTFEEACDYLNPRVWRFPELRDEVARVLGNHPRALGLLVGHAGDYKIHPGEVRDLINSLPDEQGETDLREVVCNKILGHVVRHLKSESIDTWWALLLASVFVENFEERKFERVKQAIPQNISIPKSYDVLSNLTRRSLLNEGEYTWEMHSLVRGYAQTIFSKEFPKQYRVAHQKAGETYFPLSKTGRLLSSPSSQVKALYANAGSCSTALYHFETAGYEKGQQAILGNYYEHLVPKVQHWLNNPKVGLNPVLGFMKAEGLLRKILEGNKSRAEEEVQYPGAREVPYDINRLMGKALYRQRRKDKYVEAAVHYRYAFQKGDSQSLPSLISVLCDLSEDEPVTSEHWTEAQRLFGELSSAVFAGKYQFLPNIGLAYEKIAQRYLLFGETLLANLIVQEAIERNMKWDGVYFVGAKIAEIEARHADVIPLLEQGLRQVRQSARLWLPYYRLKVTTGEVTTIPKELRFYPRGIAACLDLSNDLEENGYADEALTVLRDGLRIYEHNAALLTQLGNTLMRCGDFSGAVNAYREAIDVNPLNGDLYLALGKLYRQHGDDDEALKIYQLGCANEVLNTGVYIAHGQLLAGRGQLDEARKVFDEAFARWPANDELYNALGQIYEEAAEHAAEKRIEYNQRAMDIYRRGLERSSSLHHLYESVGDLLQSQGKDEEALANYERGSELAPSYEVLYEKASTFHEKFGKQFEACGDSVKAEEEFSAAEKIFRKALELGFSKSFWLHRSALLSLARGDLESARKAGAEALIADEYNPLSYDALGRVHMLLQEFQAAREIYQQGLEKCGPDARLYLSLVEAMEKEGDLAGAIKICRGWASVSSGDKSHATLISLLLKTNRAEDKTEAKELFEARISKHPNSEELIKLIPMFNADAA